MTTTYLMNQQSVTAPVATSPALTISGDTSNISYDVQVACPTDPADSMSITIERSTDSGASWQGVAGMDCTGGVIKKGPNQGQPYTLETGGTIWPVDDGDLLRANVTTVDGGTWICTAAVTQS